MQAGVGGFAHGVEAGQVGAAVQIGDHAAAGVVRRRHHRDGLARDVDAQAEAARVDGGEVFLEEGLSEMAGVEPDMVEAVFFHLEVDGAGDDVARRQFQALIVRGHEPCAHAVRRVCVGQREVGALAAQRLGDEETAFLRVVEASGMELDELHVADTAARAPGHRDAVAGGGLGVAGVAVDLAHAACGQHHGAGGQGLDAAAVHVERVHTVAARRLPGAAGGAR